MESLVFRKINGGGVWSEDGIDGSLNINPNILWHTDWENAPDPAAVVFDLYSIVLHEALHILGYASTLAPGDIFEEIPAPEVNETESLFASKWDHLLRLRTLDNIGVADPSFTPLLSQIDQTVFYEFNDATFPNTNALFAQVNDNCTDPLSTITVGWDIPVAVSGMDGGVITTVGSYLNALSHLHRNCGNGDRDFVMLPGFNVREQRQEILVEELAILCDLGYNIEGCNSCFVSPNLEGVTSSVANYDFFTTCCTFETRLCVGEEHLFSFNDLLCNEIHNIDAEVMITGFSVFGQAQDIIQVDYESETISLTPASEGDFQIFYNLESCEGMPVLSTVFFTSIPCFDCAEVTVCENIICTNDFNFEENTGVGDLIFGTPWAILNDNTPDICVDNEDNGVLLIAAFESNREGVSIELEAPIPPGCIVNISFDGLSSQNTVGTLEFYGSMIRPCPIWETRINAGEEPTLCENNTYNPVRMQVVPIENTIVGNVVGCQQDEYDLVNYDFSWENNTNESLGFITFYSSASENFIVLDNLIVNLDCTTAGFEFEANCLEIILMANIVDENIMHSWDLGDGNTENGNTVEYAYAESGIYTITHTATDICGNETTTMAEIIVVDCCFDLDPAFTYTQDCEAGEVILTASNNDGTHSWEVDGVTYDGLSVTLHITDPTVPFTATVTHTVENECEESNAITLVIDDLEACETSFTCPCEGENAINIDAGEGTLLSTLIINGDMPVGGINNQCLAINGHLIIDEAANGGNGFYTFAQSEIRMQPGAKITVQPGAALAVSNNSNSGVHGCEFLWQGIYLAPQAGLTSGGRLRLSATLIEDAIHAVHLGSGSVFEMSFTTFNRNHIGIYVPPSPQLQYVVQPTSINYSNFRCTSDLLPPYPGQIINTGSIGLAGVELNDCKYFQIGGGDIFGVRITDTNYGVIVRRAGVEMLNSRIHDLVSDASLPQSNTGILGDDGIWIRLKNNRFYNLQQGVHSVSSSLSASKNIVGEDLQGNRGNVRIGFNLRMGMGDIVRVFDQNKCYTQSYGILTSNTHAANKVIIDDNIFELLSPPMGVTNFDAIRLGDALESGINDDDLQISSNQINLHHRGSGISLYGVNGADIADNDINFLSTVEATGPGKLGINLYSSSDNYVYDNRIFGATPSDYQTGIYVYEGDRNKLCCNAVTNTYFGALFYGTCEVTLLRHTTFTGNSRGLQCNQNTRIGEQIAAGNTWDESLVWQAAHYSTNFNDVFESRFFVVSPPGSSVWPDDVFTTLNNIDWFVEGAVAPSCADDLMNCEPPSLEQLTTNDQFTQKLMQGDFYYGAYPATSDWEAKRVYYRSQRATSVEDRGNWTFESASFYQQQESQNTDLHQLTSVAQQLEQAYAPDTDLSDVETRIHSLAEELQALDVTLVEGTSPSANYLAEREALFMELEEMVVIFHDFKEVKRNELSAIVAQLLPQNSNIVTTGEAATKQQAVNRWYLETIAQGIVDLPVATEEALREIAESCPLRYGSAVGRAQSLLINYGKSFAEPIDCQPTSNLQSNDPVNNDSSLESMSDWLPHQVNSKHPEQVAVYPNPSSGIFTVAWPIIGVETHRQIEVFDLRGKLLLTQPVYGEQSRLDVTHLPPGLYWIKLKGVDSVISRRIIIQ
ncbi:T9SS type A sorting domain-containing protein [Lewinella sp. LCG006]|uniref:T9SS type A sorting domain-containing protein n=1 Tax=Lewinella sp. LCG006 TaxID=3231911 RepID=UPI00345FE433